MCPAGSDFTLPIQLGTVARVRMVSSSLGHWIRVGAKRRLTLRAPVLAAFQDDVLAGKAASGNDTSLVVDLLTDRAADRSASA